jgi:hypothetical protein
VSLCLASVVLLGLNRLILALLWNLVLLVMLAGLILFLIFFRIVHLGSFGLRCQPIAVAGMHGEVRLLHGYLNLMEARLLLCAGYIGKQVLTV